MSLLSKDRAAFFNRSVRIDRCYSLKSTAAISPPSSFPEVGPEAYSPRPIPFPQMPKKGLEFSSWKEKIRKKELEASLRCNRKLIRSRTTPVYAHRDSGLFFPFSRPCYLLVWHSTDCGERLSSISTNKTERRAVIEDYKERDAFPSRGDGSNQAISGGRPWFNPFRGRWGARESDRPRGKLGAQRIYMYMCKR